MPPDRLAIAAIQLNSQDDVTENLARAETQVAAASRAGAEVVVLPENFAFMGAGENDKLRIAESLAEPGPILRAVLAMAARHGVHIVAGGLPERSDDPERPYNTSVLASPEGTMLATYRKIHLFDVDLPDGTSLKESSATRAGETSPGDRGERANVAVYDVRGWKIGMSICYDLRFPELYRALGDLGARVVTVPAAFTLTTGKDHWHVLLRARAIENQVFVVAAAQHGKHPRGRQTYGKSLIVDPWGDVLAQAPEGDGFALAHIDASSQDRVRGGASLSVAPQIVALRLPDARVQGAERWKPA